MTPVILSLSGGKDSAAAALFLREQEIPHTRIFMDTGWEHPDLYAHLDYLEEELGEIIRIQPRIPDLPAEVLPEVEAIEALVGRSPSAFVRWAVRKGMFPSRVRRYCTQELKVRPFLRYVDSLDDDVINVVGIRAAESHARASLPEREPMPGAEHIEVWRPLIRWSEADVIAIHQRHNLRPCPLYLRGASRVGCWPCIMARKGELALLARTDPRRVEAMKLLEALVTRQGMVRGNSDRTLWGFFQAPYAEIGADGRARYPCWPIERVLEWAQTERGGRQMSLGGGWGQEAVCVRWGMCDVGDEP
jgi:3'-phosphoadenosine 5'-phosphosulfate sulfotransferase (PAPS reductase)/FAD synthetase